MGNKAQLTIIGYGLLIFGVAGFFIAIFFGDFIADIIRKGEFDVFDYIQKELSVYGFDEACKDTYGYIFGIGENKLCYGSSAIGVEGVNCSTLENQLRKFCFVPPHLRYTYELHNISACSRQIGICNVQ